MVVLVPDEELAVCRPGRGGCQDGQQRLALVGLGAGQGEAGRQALRVQPLKLGETSEPPAKKKPLVVPVASVSRPTAEGISAALSLGDSVVAVTVRLTGPEDEAAGLSFRGGWEQWHQNVPLMTLRSARFAHRDAAAASR